MKTKRLYTIICRVFLIDKYFLKIKKHHIAVMLSFGDPEGIRTPGLLIRSQTLYPAELLSHVLGTHLY